MRGVDGASNSTKTTGCDWRPLNMKQWLSLNQPASGVGGITAYFRPTPHRQFNHFLTALHGWGVVVLQIVCLLAPATSLS